MKQTMKNSFFLYLLLFGLICNQVAAQNAVALTKQAESAYNGKEYEKSEQHYKAAILAGDQNATTYYNLACVFALRGNTDEAFRFLEQSIARGYANVENFKKDTDLVSLHADARWQQVIAEAEVKLNEQKNAYWNQKTFWDNPALNTPFKENLSEDEKIIGLSKLWSEVKYNFSNFELIPDVNWDAIYAEYLPKVKQTKSTLEYYRLLMEMGARLKDGHTQVFIPKELREEYFSRPAIQTRLVEDKILIIDVFDPALQQNGIETGQEILAIDSIPVKDYAAKQIAPYQVGAAKQDLEARIYDYQLLIGSSKNPIELTLKDVKGKIFKKTLPRQTDAQLEKFQKPDAPFEFKMLPGNTAYVALNSFADNRAGKMFGEAFDEIAKSDSLIIDVRENGGGNDAFGLQVLSCLTDKPIPTLSGYTRQYRPLLRAAGRPQDTYGVEFKDGYYPPNGKKLYSKPVIVLTSPRTYSAAEDFVVFYSQMNRGLIIGEPTGGSTGQPLFISLPGGGGARIVTQRLKFSDGREFLGKGVQPDIIVLPTIKDVRAKRDGALEAAIAKLK